MKSKCVICGCETENFELDWNGDKVAVCTFSLCQKSFIKEAFPGAVYEECK